MHAVPLFSRGRMRRSGAVLILALALIALMMILLLALLHGTSAQMRAAQNEGATAREKMLADSAVALVIGQIQLASAQTNQTWISQPGLLRTYDQTATRKPTACYKLYSSTNMLDTSGSLGFFAADVPSDWNSSSNRSIYTDLNSPTKMPGLFGQSIYPIFDPAATNTVTGLSIDASHGAEMPVAWLYQFEDGTFGPASQGSKTNPIVARFAFWTDDESCKINVNTAGIGSPWNTPRVNSTNDVAWSTTQPANGEFSAYPGHPATTSLGVVFGTNSLTAQQLLGLSPRYAWGGSQFGAQTTTAGQSVTPKMDRLYASPDELIFGSGFNWSGQREPSVLSASQIETARFVLTAHSSAPETTMLGEPRIAIWPVSDSPSVSNCTTASDREIASAATVGSRAYYFQRMNPLSATDDLDATLLPSNAQLFSDLIARGSIVPPGYAATFAQKYSGAAWPQVALELTDYIRGLNAIDPSASPFDPYAAGDSNGVGRAFIVPLTTTYGTDASTLTLRGFGRAPTLSSLTLVLYVCGYVFDDGTLIDYDATPDDASGTSWNANFAVASTTNRWKHVKSELVRAFVVPCTYQPGCAYPEVSEACDIQIAGLDGLRVSSGTASGDFGFTATATSRLLSDAQTVTPVERAWGGNEGPLAWRAASLDAATGTYAFGGTKAFAVPLATGATIDSLTGGPSLPGSWTRAITVTGVNGLTVRLRDHSGVTFQTCKLDLPTFSIHAPTANGECDHADGSTEATARSDWATNTATKVAPSWYMSLRHRLFATQTAALFLSRRATSAAASRPTAILALLRGSRRCPPRSFIRIPATRSTQSTARVARTRTIFASPTAPASALPRARPSFSLRPVIPIPPAA